MRPTQGYQPQPGPQPPLPSSGSSVMDKNRLIMLVVPCECGKRVAVPLADVLRFCNPRKRKRRTR